MSSFKFIYIACFNNSSCMKCLLGKISKTLKTISVTDALHQEEKRPLPAACSQTAVSKHTHGKLGGRKKCGRKTCKSNRDNSNQIVEHKTSQESESFTQSVTLTTRTRTGLRRTRTGGRNQDEVPTVGDKLGSSAGTNICFYHHGNNSSLA